MHRKRLSWNVTDSPGWVPTYVPGIVILSATIVPALSGTRRTRRYHGPRWTPLLSDSVARLLLPAHSGPRGNVDVLSKEAIVIDGAVGIDDAQAIDDSAGVDNSSVENDRTFAQLHFFVDDRLWRNNGRKCETQRPHPWQVILMSEASTFSDADGGPCVRRIQPVPAERRPSPGMGLQQGSVVPGVSVSGDGAAELLEYTCKDFGVSAAAHDHYGVHPNFHHQSSDYGSYRDCGALWAA